MYPKSFRLIGVSQFPVSSLPLDVKIGQLDRARVHRLGELDGDGPGGDGGVSDLWRGRVVEREGDRAGGNECPSGLGHDWTRHDEGVDTVGLAVGGFL